MIGPRIRLSGMLAVVGVLGIGGLALRQAADGDLALMTGWVRAVLIGAAAVPLVTRGGPRVFAAGFAAAGWCYFVAARRAPTSLFTADWLLRVHEWTVGVPAGMPAASFTAIQTIFDSLVTGHLLLTLAAGAVGGLGLLAVFAVLTPARRPPSSQPPNAPISTD